MGKDQALGGVILAVCVIVAVVFVVLVVFPSSAAGLLGFAVNADTGTNLRLDIVLILISVAFIAILGIGAWIGWTMASTPPPKPIEEITAEVEADKNTP